MKYKEFLAYLIAIAVYPFTQCEFIFNSVFSALKEISKTDCDEPI
jgi:hypothetical protein